MLPMVMTKLQNTVSPELMPMQAEMLIFVHTGLVFDVILSYNGNKIAYQYSFYKNRRLSKVSEGMKV